MTSALHKQISQASGLSTPLCLCAELICTSSSQWLNYRPHEPNPSLGSKQLASDSEKHKLPNPINYTKHTHSQSGIFCTTTKVAGQKPTRARGRRVILTLCAVLIHSPLHISARPFLASHSSHTTEGFPSSF